MVYALERRYRADERRLQEAHAAHWGYWRQAAARGLLINGGRWKDGRGETLIVDVDDEMSLRRLLLHDPYTCEDLISDTVVREWNITVGGGRPPAAEAAGAVQGEEITDSAGAASPAYHRHTGRGRCAERSVIDGWPSRVHEALTAHERRIARMMLDGMTNREIADHFSVSARAVEQHITQIYRKLSIKRRAQLAVALRRTA